MAGYTTGDYGTGAGGCPCCPSGVTCDCATLATTYPTLYCTGVGGKIALTFAGGFWSGSVVITVTGVALVGGLGGNPVICFPCPGTTSGAMTVSISISCTQVSPGVATFTLSWNWVAVGCGGCFIPGPATGPYQYVLDSSTCAVLGFCAGNPANPFVDTVTGTLTASDCTPMVGAGLAITMPGMGNFTNNPGSSTATITTS